MLNCNHKRKGKFKFKNIQPSFTHTHQQWNQIRKIKCYGTNNPTQENNKELWWCHNTESLSQKSHWSKLSCSRDEDTVQSQSPKMSYQVKKNVPLTPFWQTPLNCRTQYLIKVTSQFSFFNVKCLVIAQQKHTGKQQLRREL